VEYTAFLFALIGLISSPFLLWIHRRRERWRRPGLAMKTVVTTVAVLVFGASAADGYFYPYGNPGSEMPGWRAMGDACWAAYAQARTARDTAAVDSVQPVTDIGDPNSVFTCGSVRRNRLLGCRPGTRCGRLKARLGLPGN
jgi:hypothetical protein